jgi:3'-5' exoribonuclease
LRAALLSTGPPLNAFPFYFSDSATPRPPRETLSITFFFLQPLLMVLLTISELKKAARESSPVEASVHTQIERITRKEASNGKPFQELQFRDSADSMTLRAWSDSDSFEAASSLEPGAFVAIEGIFSHSSAFGLDGKRWEIARLDEDAIDSLLLGSSERRGLLARCEKVITDAVSSVSDPRLKALCTRFLDQYGARFNRSAAARGNHHARRGGLLEHTSRMMESALALAPVYPELNRDLLITGVLFHDSGKLWETCPPELGFSIVPEVRGELLGHLSIGIELVNTLWRELPKEGWEALTPPSEDVRLHLLHLIASHHGQLEFGSPVLPKTPEAALLHFVDNIDARMEMFFSAYQSAPSDREGPMEWVRALGVSPVPALAAFQGTESSQEELSL